MNKYLLDKNIISELRKKNRCNPKVRNWFSSIDEQKIFLSVLVIGELRRGIESIRRRDPDAAFHLETWLKKVISTAARKSEVRSQKSEVFLHKGFNILK